MRVSARRCRLRQAACTCCTATLEFIGIYAYPLTRVWTWNLGDSHCAPPCVITSGSAMYPSKTAASHGVPLSCIGSAP